MPTFGRPFPARKTLLALALASTVVGCRASPEATAALVAQADGLSESGSLREAEQLYAKAARQHDDLPDLWLGRGRNALKLQAFGDALQFYQRAIELNPTNREALEVLAQLNAMSGDTQQAAKYADRLLTLDPSNVNAKLVEGQLAVRRGDLGAGEQSAQEVLKLDPQNVSARILMSRVLQQRGDTPGALAAIVTFEPQAAQNFELRNRLERLYEASADAPGLLRLATAAVSVPGAGCEADIELTKRALLVGTPSLAGDGLQRCFSRQFDEKQVGKFVDEMLDGAIDVTRLVTFVETGGGVTPGLLTALARLAIAQAQPAIAIRLLAPVVARSPLTRGLAPLFGTQALALAQSKQLDKAAALAGQVLALDPGQPDARLARATVALTRGQREQAVGDVNVVLRDNPARTDAILLQSALQRAGGQDEEAMSTIAAAANRSASDLRLTRRYAEALLMKGRREDALEQVQDFTVAAPASRGGWLLRAAICGQAGDSFCRARALAKVARLSGQAVAVPPPPASEATRIQDSSQR